VALSLSTAAGAKPTVAAATTAASGTLTGGYTITVAAADNPALVQDGELRLDAIANLALLLDYEFTPRA
jgi:hypothetical protein